jgi:hypothetical protein
MKSPHASRQNIIDMVFDILQPDGSQLGTPFAIDATGSHHDLPL